MPFVCLTKIPPNFSHPINGELGGEGRFKDPFHFVRGREIREVVHVNPKIKRRAPRDGGPSEDAWVVGEGSHPNEDEGGAEGIVPMFGAPTESIERFVEQPELARSREGAPGRGPHNNDFVGG